MSDGCPCHVVLRSLGDLRLNGRHPCSPVFGEDFVGMF